MLGIVLGPGETANKSPVLMALAFWHRRQTGKSVAGMQVVLCARGEMESTDRDLGWTLCGFFK